MPTPLRTIPRPPSSRTHGAPRVLMTRPTSPEREATYWLDDPGDPATADFFASATGRVAANATAAASLIADIGRGLWSTVSGIARDAGNLVYGAATGEFFDEPGPIASTGAKTATALAGRLPAALQPEIAAPSKPTPRYGYLTAGGKTYLIPEEPDPTTAGEKAQTARATAALRPQTDAITAATLTARVKAADIAQREAEFARTHAATLRTQARADEQWSLTKQLLENQIRATAPTQRGLQYWWQEPDLATKPAAARLTIGAIGSGVPGGIRLTPSAY